MKTCPIFSRNLSVSAISSISPPTRTNAKICGAPLPMRPDEIRYRFGDRLLTVRRGKHDNDITIALRNENH